MRDTYATVRPNARVALVWLLLLFPAGPAGQDSLNIERQAQTRTLANGLTVVVVERPGTASFGGMLGCKAGTVDDPPGGAGTAHLVEHFLAGPTLELIGPPKARMRDLRQEYEKTGGADSPRVRALEAEIAAARKGRQQWSIATVHDLVFYGVIDYPAAGLDRFLQAAAETMKAVPTGFIETQRQVLIDEITKKIATDVSNQTANFNLTTVFAGHPYGAPIGGVPSDVAAMTLDSVRAFKQAYYLIGTGFGEEVRARGYVQSRLNEALGRSWVVWGTSFGPGLLIASVLFGLSHLYQLGATRLDPYTMVGAMLGALFFGAVRERSGSVLGSAVVHGGTNACLEVYRHVFSPR